MWISERTNRTVQQEAAADLGAVTLGGDPAGVALGGERRWLNVYAPGGYSWRPTVGQKVLVLKAGAERELPCIVGTTQDAEGLKPGETRLTGGNSSIHLGQQDLALSGHILVNGMELERYVREIVSEMIGSLGG